MIHSGGTTFQPDRFVLPGEAKHRPGIQGIPIKALLDAGMR
jgi:predicted YcjX-like family ATPase